DAVVEKNVIQIEIASNSVNEVIAADRERIAVAGDDPNAEIRIRTLDTGRNRGRAAVNTVKTVRVHVVRKTRRAANARHEHDLLTRNAELRHHLLHVVQNGVIAASRAPTHFLIGNKVSLLQLSRRRRNATRDRRPAITLRRHHFSEGFVYISIPTMSVTLRTHYFS